MPTIRTYNDAGVAAFSSENFGVYIDGGLAESEGSSALGGEDFDKAMDYMNKARQLLETLSEIEDKQNLANVCASLSMSLSNREDVDNALPLAQKAVDIFEKYPPQNLYEKAHAHQCLAACFMFSKRYAEALKQELMNVAIKEQLIPSNHPELAAAYRSLAEVYALNEEFERAVTYCRKSIDILENFFTEPTSELLSAYRLLHATYTNAGHVEQALSLEEKIMDIFNRLQNSIWSGKLAYAERMIEAAEVPVDENILRNNPTVAEELLTNKLRALVKYNRAAAEACRRLKDYVSAEKFIVAACEKLSDKISPDETSTVMFTAAQIFFDTGKFADALSAALDAAEKLLDFRPFKFDKLSERLLFLGKVYEKLGDDEHALKNFNAAIMFQQKNPYPENAMLESATLSAAKTLIRLNNFDEAEKILQELLTGQRKSLSETHPRIEAVKNLLKQIREKKSPSE